MMSKRQQFNWRFPAGVLGLWLVLTAILVGLVQMVFGHVWPLAQTFGRWDAGWYETIVNHGYTAGLVHGQANVAFFPLYPLLVGLAWWLTHLPVWLAGVMVSVLSFGAALVLFYDLAARSHGESTARWATVLLAFNPWGLFFALVYTESLFLLVSVGVFWLLERRLWWWAAVVAGLASATRVVGLVLGLIVVAQWAWSQRAQWRQPSGRFRLAVTAVGLGLVSASGMAAFMLFLYVHNHDALAFLHVQRAWERTGPAQLVTEFRDHYYRQIFFNIQHHLSWLNRANAYSVWYGATLAGLTGLGLLIWKREYWWAAYVALGMAGPLASGTVVSMDRYVMALFPIYIGVAWAVRGHWRWLAVAMSGVAWASFWVLDLHVQSLFFG